MIVDKILNELQWTPYGIQCPSTEIAWQVHKFLREAILDYHLYVTKIIGFRINSNNTFRSHAGTYIARHMQIGESYPELLVKMLDKVFLDIGTQDLTAMLHAGANTLPDTTFTNERNEIVKTLYTDPELCRVIEKDCMLQVKTLYSCGHNSMQQNSKQIGSEYFPCYTDFSVMDYFRVLPIQPNDTLVPIRSYNGATLDDLKTILIKYLLHINMSGIRKDELTWVQSFTL